MTATDVLWDELAGTLGDRLRDDLLQLVHAANDGAARSKQTDLGPSEIGDPCTRCLAAKILGVHTRSPFYDPWPAIIGTAVHAWLEKAANRAADKGQPWCAETRVYPDPVLLPSGGSADLYRDDIATVIDHKIVGPPALKKYKANGPGVAYRRQGHLYGLGFENAGVTVEHVAIAFWPRGGRMQDLHVWTEPYDRQYALEALHRYSTLRTLCTTGGEAILPSLPTDPACFTCSRT